MEQWKAVEGYEGLYEVSDQGNVRSLRKGRNLKPWIGKTGYPMVDIYVKGKRDKRSVHRLVGKAFCEGYSEGLVINHKDGIRDNNVSSNLEWTTFKGNADDMVRRGTQRYNKHSLKILHIKRTKYVECLDRDGNALAVFNSITQASNALGIGVTNIYNACKGKWGTAGGFKWRYVK